MTKVIVVDDTEIVWLYRAGRSIVFIASHLGISSRQVRKELLAVGLLKPPRPRRKGVANYSSMNASTVVPEGDPLLTALKEHHSECLKKENDQCPQPGQTRK